MLCLIISLVFCGIVSPLQSEELAHQESFSSASNIAREAGYTYLAVCPRYYSTAELVQLFEGEGQGSNQYSWLTKCTEGEVATLLHEGANRLPLFLYPLENLDDTSFCITSKTGSTSHSSQRDSFAEKLHSSSTCPVVFDRKPLLGNPYFGFITKDVEKKIKCNFRNMKLVTIEPLYQRNFYIGDPISWVAGISKYSPYSLWYALNNYSYTELLEFLQVEYPKLAVLLDQPSRIEGEKTLRERAQYLDETVPGTQLTDKEVFFRIANIAHELGGAFGPQEEVKINSYPLFLSLLEQVGLNKSYGHIIDWFYLKHDVAEFDILVGRSPLPRDDVVECVLYLFELFKTPSSQMQSIEKAIRVSQQFFSEKDDLKHTLKPLFSKYFWEKIDPLHRHGTSVLVYRTRFESLILDTPKSDWSGAFIPWLNENYENGVPSVYLSAEERRNHLAHFEGNKIISPVLAFPSTNVIFVIDEFENIYLAEKTRGDQSTPGFYHSSFLSGDPVVSAGKLVVNADGIIEKIHDHSGHYRPGPLEHELALKIFEKKGVKTSTQ